MVSSKEEVGLLSGVEVALDARNEYGRLRNPTALMTAVLLADAE
jgi:hypothetical protein